LAECRQRGGCPTGQARLTAGHRLLARYVIHAVGPVYRSGRAGEADLLRSCYEEALRLAAGKEAESIAFPCISTGIFGYPKPDACQVATHAVTSWLNAHDHPRRVIFCCFELADVALYRDFLRETLKTPEPRRSE
jgi:O-acetyl-ADP-ribose deacetylase (regulator of RNase III)